MDAEKLFDAVKRQPFLPVRIHLTDGSHYDITHPDQIYTQRDAVYIFAFKESQGADMETFEKEKSLLEQTVLSAKRQRALQRFVEILKVKARIEVEPEALEGS